MGFKPSSAIRIYTERVARSLVLNEEIAMFGTPGKTPSASSGPLVRGIVATAILVAGVSVQVSAVAAAPPASAEQINSELKSGYQVAAGDKLRVTVFDEPTLTGEYVIGVGGELSLPLIDAIPARGQNPTGLAQLITEELKAGGYVLAPRVAVEIIEHRPFYILGEVKQPGEYPYSGDLTFEQAVARAGGFTPRANRRVIEMRRQDWSASQRVKLNGQALKIAPGDTITVRESFF